MTVKTNFICLHVLITDDLEYYILLLSYFSICPMALLFPQRNQLVQLSFREKYGIFLPSFLNNNFVTFDKAFPLFECKDTVKRGLTCCAFYVCIFLVSLMSWILQTITCAFKFSCKMPFVHCIKNSLEQHYIHMILKSNKYLMVSQKTHNLVKRTQNSALFSSLFFIKSSPDTHSLAYLQGSARSLASCPPVMWHCHHSL